MLAEVILQGYTQKKIKNKKRSSVSDSLKMAVGIGVGRGEGGRGGRVGFLWRRRWHATVVQGRRRKGREGSGARRLHHLTAA